MDLFPLSTGSRLGQLIRKVKTNNLPSRPSKTLDCFQRTIRTIAPAAGPRSRGCRPPRLPPRARRAHLVYDAVTSVVAIGEICGDSVPTTDCLALSHYCSCSSQLLLCFIQMKRMSLMVTAPFLMPSQDGWEVHHSSITGFSLLHLGSPVCSAEAVQHQQTWELQNCPAIVECIPLLVVQGDTAPLVPKLHPLQNISTMCFCGHLEPRIRICTLKKMGG